MSKRTIAVFTGNRAEYGLQFPILKAIAAHPGLEYKLIVSGAHLDKNFGSTRTEIENDGFTISAEVKLDMDEDSLYATAQAIGSGVVSMSKALAKMKPDMLLIYSDRFEGLAAIIASTQMNVPTAHVEGGDVTEGGALDDSVRHAMTKLAHLHFTTNENSAWRVRQMGEEEWRVHNVGLPSIDQIVAGDYASPEELNEKFGIDPQKPLVIFTQHSVATRFEEAAAQIRPSLEALEIVARDGAQVIITYPNNDAGGMRIINELNEFAKRGVPNLQIRKSLGHYNYHGALHLCGNGGKGVCAGNSSSGVKETPAFKCPAVNIGSRQDGRLTAENVINTGYGKDEVLAAIRRGLYDGEFRALSQNCENPYGGGGSGKMIADILASAKLGQRLITKKMTIKQ